MDMLGGGDADEAAEFLQAPGAGGRGEGRLAGVKQFSAKQKTAMIWWANPRYQEYDAIICDGAVRSGKDAVDGDGLFPVGDAAL